MRLSQLFFTSLRDDPAEAEMPSHRLLVRAGYVRQLGAGIYTLLPLGFRVTKRVEQVIREEIDRIGGQEMEMPVVHPAELWKESGRYFKIGPELVRFKDRAERDMVLAMTHEEVVATSCATSSGATASCRSSSTTSRPSSATSRARAAGSSGSASSS